MRREIQSKLKYMEVVKTHYAVYVIKHQLDDDLAASFQNEAEVLHRLNTGVESRKDIIFDIQRNIGINPKFEMF